MKLTGHKTEGEHRKYTHHEMDNLRARRQKNPVPWLIFKFPAARKIQKHSYIADSVYTLRQAHLHASRDCTFSHLPILDDSRAVESQNRQAVSPRSVPAGAGKNRAVKMPDIKARLERTLAIRPMMRRDWRPALAASRAYFRDAYPDTRLSVRVLT